MLVGNVKLQACKKEHSMLNKKNILSVLLACTFFNLVALDDMDSKKIAEKDIERKNERQRNLNEIQKVLEELINKARPVFEGIYKNHFEQIEELEENYIIDKERGDIVINDLVNDSKQEINTAADSLCEKIAAEQLFIDNLDEFKKECKEDMQDIIRITSTLGMQMSTEIRSKVRQERKAQQWQAGSL
jgi:hypothetical protein